MSVTVVVLPASYWPLFVSCGAGMTGLPRALIDWPCDVCPDCVPQGASTVTGAQCSALSNVRHRSRSSDPTPVGRSRGAVQGLLSDDDSSHSMSLSDSIDQPNFPQVTARTLGLYVWLGWVCVFAWRVAMCDVCSLRVCGLACIDCVRVAPLWSYCPGSFWALTPTAYLRYNPPPRLP